MKKQLVSYIGGLATGLAIALLTAATPPVVPLSHTITSGEGNPNVTLFVPQVRDDTNIRIETVGGVPITTWVWLPGSTNWK